MQLFRGRDFPVFIGNIEFMNGVIRPAVNLKGGLVPTNLCWMAVGADNLAIFVSDDGDFHVHILQSD
jgi:hypothetical protein